MNKRLTIAVVGTFFANPAWAQEAEVFALGNVLVFSEMALSTAALVKDHYSDEIQVLTWDAEFGPDEWNVTMIGHGRSDSKLAIEVSGVVERRQDQSWDVSFSGEGSFGDDPVSLTGSGIYGSAEIYGEVVAAATMDFEQQIKIGTSTRWGWIKGAEFIIGGALGGAAGIMATPATGGASLIVGLGGAMAGAASAVSLSNEARTIFDSEDPDPASSGSTDEEPGIEEPETPERPALPEPDTLLNPDGKHTLVAAIVEHDLLIGQFPADDLDLRGTFDIGSGFASGSVMTLVAPEG